MVRLCQRCGATLGVGVVTCGYCGAVDDGKSAEPPRREAPPVAEPVAEPVASPGDDPLEGLSSRERARRRLEAEGLIEPPTTEKKPRRSLALLAIAPLAVFLFFCPHVSMNLMGGPYEKAVAEAAGCKMARDAIGDDIHLSWLGFPYGSNHGGSGGFRFPISGSKKGADLNYSFRGDAVTWDLLVAGKRVVDSKECKANPSASASATASASAKKPEPPEKPYRVKSWPFLLDVDKDGHEDAIVLVEQGAPYFYAAFDGIKGTRVWRSADLVTERWNDPAYFVGGWLMIAGSAGQLAGYDFSSDRPSWTLNLGERLEKLCESTESGTVRADVAGEKSILVTLKTGAQAPMPRKAPCKALRSNRPYQPRIPDLSTTPARPGEHVLCNAGGKGADPCSVRTSVNPAALDGMTATSIRVVENGYVVIGERHPGSAYPMVGLLRSRAFVWKSDVPLLDPLLAKGPPYDTALAGGTIVVSYQAGRDSFITAFDVATGHRDWHVAFTPGTTPGVWASRDTVFAFADSPDALVAYAMDSGAERFALRR